MNRIDTTLAGQLVAAELSSASYTPLATYQTEVGGIAGEPNWAIDPSLPEGWYVDVGHSNIDADDINQFITFVNPVESQIVIAFKGTGTSFTQTIWNLYSDLRNNGAQEYADIRQQAQDALAAIKADPLYSGYTIVTDGHSLGGGMAQTFAVQNTLSGFGQNSLPIAAASISADPNFATERNTWQSTPGLAFYEDNEAGDIATAYYTNQIETEAQNGDPQDAYLYTPATTKLLSSDAATNGQIGLDVINQANDEPLFKDYVLPTGLGTLVGKYLGYTLVWTSAGEAHSINTVIASLQSLIANAPTAGTTLSSAQTSDVLADTEDASSVTTNSDGSVTFSEPDGSVWTVQAPTQAADGGFTDSATVVGSASDAFLTGTLTQAADNQLTFDEELDDGSSAATMFTQNADGSTSSVTTHYAAAGLSGAVTFTQMTTQSAAGAVAIAVTGSGDNVSLANVPVSLGTGASVVIDDPTSFNGTISGFVPGATLDLAGIGTADTATLHNGNGLAVTEDNGSSLAINLDPNQSYSSSQYFLTRPDGSGGTDISVYSESTISVTGATFTRAFGINNNGDIVGQYAVANTLDQLNGFVDIGGNITTFSEPNAVKFFGQYGPITVPTGINDSDQVVGTYFDGTNLAHGFIYSGGVYQSLNFPGATQTTADGINNAGEIVGSFTDSRGLHGFLYNAGSYTEIDVPGATETAATGINNLGEIVGTYTSSTGRQTLVFSYSAGNFTTYTPPPNSTVSGGPFVVPYEGVDVNDAGAIVAPFSDSQGESFLQSGSITYFNTISTSAGLPDVQGDGINNSGEIVGTTGGNSGPAGFLLSSEGLDTACYVRGTLIATPSGETAIEALAAGDLVLTEGGPARPVRWMGHRRIDTAVHPDPAKVWPVCVQAGAFADGVPSRDLWVSPEHALVHGRVLIPAYLLVNGRTIFQVKRPEIEYWHVELDSHDLILAEGMPAETYLDCGNRGGFVECETHVQLHPNLQTYTEADSCLPRVSSGSSLIQTKAMLLARAKELGHEMDEVDDLHIIADGKRIEPARISASRAAFLIPTGCAAITMRSRSFVPAHGVPESNDARELGVCLKRLQLDGEAFLLEDDAACAVGWHRYETKPGMAGWRWTTGSTPLPANTQLVVADIVGRGGYWSGGESEVIALFG